MTAPTTVTERHDDPGAPAPGAPVIVARDLRKRYGTYEAVKGLDVTIHRGEAFGFLGPNGAGKSSTMRMIACVSEPTDGSLTLLDLDSVDHATDIRARIGVVPQDDTLDADLTVRENLLIYGRYFGLSWRATRARIDELLTFAELRDRADHRVDQLSGGMRRRLTIARALVNDPEIVLLDEPTTGLDPQARHLVWERLSALKRADVTLVLTTHYMDEAEHLCDRLVVVDGGRIVAAGSPASLVRDHAGREVVEVHAAPDGRLDDGLAAAAVAESAGARVEVVGDRILVYTADGDAIAEDLVGRGIAAHRLRVRRAGLEDVFLLMTGRRLVE